MAFISFWATGLGHWKHKAFTGERKEFEMKKNEQSWKTFVQVASIAFRPKKMFNLQLRFNGLNNIEKCLSITTFVRNSTFYIKITQNNIIFATFQGIALFIRFFAERVATLLLLSRVWNINANVIAKIQTAVFYCRLYLYYVKFNSNSWILLYITYPYTVSKC